MDPEHMYHFFDCPVCYNTIKPGIGYKQCKNGHMVCKRCGGQLATCPVCREVLGAPPVRNLFMEQVFEVVQFPCRNDGCAEKILPRHSTEHSERCPKRPARCPVCEKQLTLDKLWDHVVQNHSHDGAIRDSNQGMFIAGDVRNRSLWSITMTSESAEKFLVVLKRYRSMVDSDEDQLFMVVYFIGPHTLAAGFDVRLDLQDKRLRCKTRAPVQGVEDSVADLRSMKSGNMCVSTSYARRFLKRGELHFDVKIFERD